MNTKTLLRPAIVVLAGMIAFSVRSQSSTNQPGESEIMATIMELAQPGENHKQLESMAGEWTYTVKWWMNPQSPPSESSGTTVAKLAMGGRYLISNHTGKMSMPGPDGKAMDMVFEGMSIEGYDNAKKKFVSSWIDNMGTGIENSEGAYDSAAKTLTYIGSYEPMPGMVTKMRQVVKCTDQDHHTMEMFEDRGGTLVKTMEINYTRKN
ncbi:MAG: DUF1579 domain-containing protein [Verrucomicrobiota bacterium]|jgi:hypothetical protein